MPNNKITKIVVLKIYESAIVECKKKKQVFR